MKGKEGRCMYHYCVVLPNLEYVVFVALGDLHRPLFVDFVPFSFD